MIEMNRHNKRRKKRGCSNNSDSWIISIRIYIKSSHQKVVVAKRMRRRRGQVSSRAGDKDRQIVIQGLGVCQGLIFHHQARM